MLRIKLKLKNNKGKARGNHYVSLYFLRLTFTTTKEVSILGQVCT